MAETKEIDQLSEKEINQLGSFIAEQMLNEFNQKSVKNFCLKLLVSIKKIEENLNGILEEISLNQELNPQEEPAWLAEHSDFDDDS